MTIKFRADIWLLYPWKTEVQSGFYLYRERQAELLENGAQPILRWERAEL